MNYDRIANALLLISTLFSMLFNITIIIIHIKQPLLKNGFFNVVFGQVITEFLINISIFFLNLIYVISGDKMAGKWIMIFPILFNFCYEAYIIYNIKIIIFLMTYNKDKDDLINYALDTEISRDSNLSHQGSISFVDVSFKSFHILSYSIATIYIILYIVNLLVFQNNPKVQEPNWMWYYYFICGNKYFWRIFFFTFHIIFFVISVIYLFKSCDKNKISKHIYLKSYALYCVFASFITIVFPIVLLVFIFVYDNNSDTSRQLRKDYLIIILLAFFVFLLSTTIFRLRNYYVDYVLSQDGKGCINWLCSALKILFRCKKMHELNFVDLHSSFIYHALSSANDLVIEDVPDNIFSYNTQKELIGTE